MLTTCVLAVLLAAAVFDQVRNARRFRLRLPQVPRPLLVVASLPLLALAFLLGVLIGLALVVVLTPLFAALSCLAPLLFVVR